MDDGESPIKAQFIEKLTHKLNERSSDVSYIFLYLILFKHSDKFLTKYNKLFFSNSQTKNDVFMMDENLVHPFKVVYKYSDIKLEDIELPDILNLDKLLTKI